MHIGLADEVIMVVVGLLFIFQIYWYCRYMAGVQRRTRHQRYKRFRWRERANGKEQTAATESKGVSVVICAKNEGVNLRDYLQVVLSQDYPLFEVIVVNDASEDNTALVLEHYQHMYPNLRLTFVPKDAMLHSSKKLGLTLAAKAATYDYLLLTDADCVPASMHWISGMMHGFDNPETEVVLGYGGYFEENTAVNRFIQYETITTAMLYLGMAMSRHPYMGVGRNLAYKKDTFFRIGGFSGMLWQKAGDDDLFVNRVATRRNTETVLTPDTFTWSVPKHTFEEWFVQKYRHLSVASAYRIATRFHLSVEPLSRGLWYLSMITVGVGYVKGYFTIVIALLVPSRVVAFSK